MLQGVLPSARCKWFTIPIAHEDDLPHLRHLSNPHKLLRQRLWPRKQKLMILSVVQRMLQRRSPVLLPERHRIRVNRNQ